MSANAPRRFVFNFVSGILVVAGLVVLTGRLLHYPSWVSLGLAGGNVAFYSSVSFVLAGIGFAGLIREKRFWVFSAGVGLILSSAAALAQLAILGPLPVPAPVETALGLAGRSSMSAALLFFAIGAAFVAFGRNKLSRQMTNSVTVLATALVALAIMTRLIQLSPSAALWVLTGMSLPTAAAGALCVALLWTITLASATEAEKRPPLLSTAVALLTVASVISFLSHTELFAATRWVVHTRNVIGSADQLVASVARMESAARAFALTGAEPFLQRAADHQRAISAHLLKLGSLTNDNPSQTVRIGELTRLSREKFAAVASLLQARREGNATSAAQILLMQQSMESSALVRQVEELRMVETDLLAHRETALSTLERRTQVTQLGTSVVALGLIALAFALEGRANNARRRAEVALRSAHELQRAILDSTLFSIIATDEKGVIREFNAGASQMLGYSAAEMVGKVTPEIIHDAAEVRARADELTVLLRRPITSGFEAFVAVVRENSSEVREWTYIRKDGSRLPVELTVTAIRDEAGRIDGFVGVAYDLSARRIAEAGAARAQAELERQKFALDQHAIVAVTDTTGRIIYVNDRFCEISGYLRSELIGQNHRVINSGLHPREFFTEMFGVISRGGVWRGEIRNRAKNGRLYWVDTTIVPFLDVHGRPQQYIAIRADITGRKAAEEALRSEEQRVRKIFSAMGDGLVIIGPNGAIIDGNPAAERILGLTRAQLLGRDSFDPRWHAVRGDGSPFPGDEHPTSVALRTGNRVSAVEMGVNLPNGAQHWILINAEPLRNDENVVIGVACSFADITKLKQLERSLAASRDEALALSRLKSEFIANMSHEIRTPMNGIIGLTNILLDSRLDTEQRNLAQVVEKSAQHLLTIINDILDFSRVEAGKLRIEPTEIDLRLVADDTLALLDATARLKGLALKLDYPDQLPTMVLGDGVRIRQILTNLVGNAVKFTDQGEVTVSVRGLVVTKERFSFQMEVKDTGVGIAPDQVVRLFAPFVQADTTSARRYGGTGLGLAISRQLVELMWGTIGVDSTLGHGSKFWFRLDLPRCEITTIRPSLTSATSAALSVRYRVLVVDDNPINQLVAEGCLRQLGHTPVVVGTAPEALALLQREHFDAVLMDCQLPGLDGYEATRELRHSEATTNRKRVPVIALTAYALPEDRFKCIEAGMDDYLSKPHSLSELAAALTRCGLPTASPTRGPA